LPNNHCRKAHLLFRYNEVTVTRACLFLTIRLDEARSLTIWMAQVLRASSIKSKV
jgi:hypothetical protein